MTSAQAHEEWTTCYDDSILRNLTVWNDANGRCFSGIFEDSEGGLWLVDCSEANGTESFGAVTRPTGDPEGEMAAERANEYALELGRGIYEEEGE
jgi:hypothetical protein